MSRILVADDNSNIQKMVALALKDEGIDVVAVGNGDAAMRKIPDLRPDLVLADIFMPVRNGYEVCEFVKSDSRYMNTPVVLLVGAFDPLDEDETQRVRADGVLKKPFVPPDPLINMVKALLAKSNGQKPVPVGAVTVQVPAQQPQMPLPPPAPARQASYSGERSEPAEKFVQRDAKADPSLQREEPVVAARAQTPAPEVDVPEGSDEVTTASRDPNLGEPFWATPEEPEPEDAEAEAQTGDEPEDIVDMHSFGKESHGGTARFRPDSAILDKVDLEAPVKKEKPVAKVELPAQTPVQPPVAAQAPSINEPAPSPVSAQSEGEASFAPEEQPAEPFKFDPALTFEPSTQPEPESMQDFPTIALPEMPLASIEPQPLAGQDAASVEPKLPELAANEDTTLSWASIADSVAETHPAPEPPAEAHAEIPPAVMDLSLLPNQDAVITAATEAARMAFSDLKPFGGAESDNNDQGASPNPPSGYAGNRSERERAASPIGVAQTGEPSPTPEMIEAVVNRLLERMQPQVMEVVNREVLRPAIEAMVRREMEKS